MEVKISMDKLKKKIGYLFLLVKILHRTDKGFLWTLIIQIGFLAIIPFIQLELTRQSIKMLTDYSKYDAYICNIVTLLLILLLLNIMSTFFQGKNELKANVIGQILYKEILKTCLFMDYEELQKKQTQEKMKTATLAFENGSLQNLTREFKVIISSVVIISGIIGIVAYSNIYLLVISCGIILVNYYILKNVKAKQYNVDKEIVPIGRQIEYFDNIAADFSIAKEVRLYHTENAMLNEYNNLKHRLVNIANKMIKTRIDSEMYINIGNHILEIAIYIILGYSVLIKKEISVAEFSAVAVAVRTFSSCMNDMLDSFTDIEKNSMHLKDYFEFIQIKSKFKKSGNRKIEASKFEIVFKNVSFKYPESEVYALKNLNLKIRNGEKISIVGENGSGKTTFVKLLLRLYDPTEGNIYINNINIKDIKYENYLDLFSTVFQDYKLYAFTIKDNIQMFNKDRNESENDNKHIMNILEKLNIKDRIESLENGLDTYLYRIFDENGVELSGGQNQKIAIARAIYKNAGIFVLDEPTAALDPRAEHEIFNDFNNMVQGKTAIYISHRLSASLLADRIIVLKNGLIAEEGKHKDLIDRNGLYAELFNLQAQYYIGEEGNGKNCNNR